MKNKKQTSRILGSVASKILRNPNSSKTAKSLAGSALAQTKTKKETGDSSEALASKVLKSSKYSGDTKKLAASLVSQSRKSR